MLLTSIEAFLKMLHPVMPHITEELYAHLPAAGKAKYLMTSSWPTLPASEWPPTGPSQFQVASAHPMIAD